MDRYLIFALLGLVLILIVIVVLMMVSLVRIRDTLRHNNNQNMQASEYMENRLRQDIRDVQENMRDFELAMNQTVNQSYTNLNITLDRMLQGSFDSINNYLGILNKDIGEMKTVASGIDDIRRVLSNVKTRGILGEIQLGSILKEMLSPSQYDENVVTIPGSSERVEFAVKFPGIGDTVYLPIDSKFPGDTYLNLLDAYDLADEDDIKKKRKALISQFKKEANDISSKYVCVPYTTDFAIMFLPFEGLYAEAINLGVLEVLRQEYNVIIAGPSTMAALLNSLQMGFKTLAIQENAKHVWNVLANVKNEFEKFSSVLIDTQTKLAKASESLDTLIGTRTKKLQKALSDVENLNDAFTDDFDDFENR